MGIETGIRRYEWPALSDAGAYWRGIPAIPLLFGILCRIQLFGVLSWRYIIYDISRQCWYAILGFPDWKK